jgi:hypothetical protein
LVKSRGGGVAEGAQKFSSEAVLTRDLSHYLHQPPGNRTRDFFGGRQADFHLTDLIFRAPRKKPAGRWRYEKRGDSRTRRMACIVPSMCAGHSMLCPYKNRRSLGSIQPRNCAGRD